ncbi:glycosyltransferase family 4 protein [Patescibacteria group bacterium]|nr:glycosyltransferase family 4 protein [Patescibacteria group bacterium]
MTIGINGNEANVSHRVGVGQYAYELLKQFVKFQTPSTKFQVYLENPPLPEMPDLPYEVFGPKNLWTLTGLQKRLLANPPDVLFTPTHYAPLYLSCPSVISVMDLAFEKFPQYFKKKDLYQLKYWTRLSAMQAKKVIAISEATKGDLVQLYHLPPEKIVVTHLGYDQARFNEKVKPARKDKYFFYLGTLQPRKNLVRLIEAFGQLEDKDIKLVIGGMKNEGRGGWMYQDVFEIASKLGDRVEFTGYIPDTEVAGLMKGAAAYVLPSLYEGFGIPAVEAMATGVPVVVSRVSSLPEVCGECTIYIENPYEVESIRSALEKVLEMGDSERKNQIKAGLKLVKRYNWEDTAKQTLEVLKNV